MARDCAAPMPTRRGVLVGAAGLAAGATLAAPYLASPSLAQGRADLVVVILSDLHSAYERLPGVIGAVDAAIAEAVGAPVLIAINGDVFERGNVAALRSEGRVDWAFLEALRLRAPTVLNLGNHETALVDDMAITVRMARQRGLDVVSNMIDKRTGAPFAEARVAIDIGGVGVDVVGIATDEINTYRQPVRPTLELPAPGAWGRANLPGLLRPGRVALVLSHGGVAGDREMLPALPDGTLLVGGHEHLRFEHRAGRTAYVHTGSWNRFVTVATIRGLAAGAPAITLDQRPVAAGEAGDPALAAEIRATLERHLTAEDRDILARSQAARDLGETGRFIAAAMARSAGADIGLISHTTLGTGLPAGEISRFVMASIVRFDGGLVQAEIGGDALQAVLAMANQDGEMALERRIGDFVYANVLAPAADRRYRLVTNGWTRLNAQRYLGRADLAFTDVQGPPIRTILSRALA